MSEKFIVTTFYKFTPLDDLAEIKLQLLKFCNKAQIKGTVLIAKEGINSTLAGTEDAINNFYTFIKSIPFFSDLEFKESFNEYVPFKKMKVKIKKEIINFKVALDINNRGEYLTSEEWDNYLNRPDAIVIDTRNDFEVAFGTFKNAVNPKTKTFTELPKWIEGNLINEHKEKPILMFCTGGVRCEKSTSYMKQLGFKNVFHLKGGILKYLEDTKNKNSLWQGSCFIFDDRLALEDNLKPVENACNA